MKPRFLLNFSTHKRDLALFDGNFRRLEEFVKGNGFHGIELYPVGEVDCSQVPKGLVRGLHLRFFVIIRELWNRDMGGLKRVFGSLDVARAFYGGLDRCVITDTYAKQMNLAQELGCSYVVFHPVHVCLENVYDWKMERAWQETLEMCCQIMDEAQAKSSFNGYLLFENLWWPGGFTLAQGQFEFMALRMKHKKCGVVLDTGHMLLEAGGFDGEKEALDSLFERIKGLGPLKDRVKALHLTCTLSGSYLRSTKRCGLYQEEMKGMDFWETFLRARKHVMEMDRHDAFTLPEAGKILELLRPEYVVFEFSYKDRSVWQEKIEQQKMALKGYFHD